ncbi:hypothetical protein RND81_05G173500 [Saponaria officinalis]|uniref:Bet v I/Major latex protein domain-containing protein n=1 Tax=Saponaria officinalis TaxID=3572 RepID=A0AAW1KZD8_SAPOF
MAKIQRVEGEIELKCEADEFFEVWARKPYLASKMCPNKHPKIELHEGNWDSVGSILTWNYVLDDGERSFVRTKIEEVDETNKCVTYNVVDGHVLKTFYNSFKPKVQAIQKGARCIVKWNFEFEKKNESAPEPTKYLDFLLSSAKDIDHHLSQA